MTPARVTPLSEVENLDVIHPVVESSRISCQLEITQNDAAAVSRIHGRMLRRMTA
jgi:hypothetical protein